jgi:hypothetical protein
VPPDRMKVSGHRGGQEPGLQGAVPAFPRRLEPESEIAGGPTEACRVDSGGGAEEILRRKALDDAGGVPGRRLVVRGEAGVARAALLPPVVSRRRLSSSPARGRPGAVRQRARGNPVPTWRFRRRLRPGGTAEAQFQESSLEPVGALVQPACGRGLQRVRERRMSAAADRTAAESGSPGRAGSASDAGAAGGWNVILAASRTRTGLKPQGRPELYARQCQCRQREIARVFPRPGAGVSTGFAEEGALQDCKVDAG